LRSRTGRRQYFQSDFFHNLHRARDVLLLLRLSASMNSKVDAFILVR
jgi:hypothetical protein